jgi:hypothetical protein
LSSSRGRPRLCASGIVGSESLSAINEQHSRAACDSVANSGSAPLASKSARRVSSSSLGCPLPPGPPLPAVYADDPQPSTVPCLLNVDVRSATVEPRTRCTLRFKGFTGTCLLSAPQKAWPGNVFLQGGDAASDRGRTVCLQGEPSQQRPTLLSRCRGVPARVAEMGLHKHHAAWFASAQNVVCLALSRSLQACPLPKVTGCVPKRGQSSVPCSSAYPRSARCSHFDFWG